MHIALIIKCYNGPFLICYCKFISFFAFFYCLWLKTSCPNISVITQRFQHIFRELDGFLETRYSSFRPFLNVHISHNPDHFFCIFPQSPYQSCFRKTVYTGLVIGNIFVQACVAKLLI